MNFSVYSVVMDNSSGVLTISYEMKTTFENCPVQLSFNTKLKTVSFIGSCEPKLWAYSGYIAAGLAFTSCLAYIAYQSGVYGSMRRRIVSCFR